MLGKGVVALLAVIMLCGCFMMPINAENVSDMIENEIAVFGQDMSDIPVCSDCKCGIDALYADMIANLFENDVEFLLLSMQPVNRCEFDCLLTAKNDSNKQIELHTEQQFVTAQTEPHAREIITYVISGNSFTIDFTITIAKRE